MSTTRHPGDRWAARMPWAGRSRTATPPADGGTEAPPRRQLPIARVAVRTVFAHANANTAIILGTTVFLTGFGLVMVLSSSSINSYAATLDPFAAFVRQALFAGFGLPLMLIAASLPPTFWRRWAPILLVGAIGAQLLVLTPLGVDVNGNRNWIEIAGMSLQPSELLKLALVLWLGYVAFSQPRRMYSGAALVFPILIVAGGALGLVVGVSHDLGTGLIVAAAILGALFFAGIRLRFLIIALAAGGVGAFVLATATSSRLQRIGSFLGGECTDYLGTCYQTLHAQYALANGGWFGVGLGNSTAKWSWLPEVQNDFIFAVIGEELGLLGAIVVILLYVVLAFGMVRVILGTRDVFVRTVVGGILVWIVGQAFVNVAVVLGLVPVLGVPLPLISSGGTALLATMIGIGVVLSLSKVRDETPVKHSLRIVDPQARVVRPFGARTDDDGGRVS